MSGILLARVQRSKARFDAKSERHGIIYPWWIGTVSKILLAGCVLISLGQRDLLIPPSWWSLTLILVLLPLAIQMVVYSWVPWWISAACVVGGSGLILTAPGNVSSAADFVPAIMTVIAAELTATDGFKAGAYTTAGSFVAILIAADDLSAMPFMEVLLGYVVGCMLWWQTRALVAERSERSSESLRATLAERQRIAHEIHDLVAHSLSVTLLHVTGARRALQQDADIPEAIDALEDAERIGGQAMADIRRTVGMLADESPGRNALPGAAEIDELVAGFHTAGLQVDYSADPGLLGLPAATGLGLFRVTQESLANIAKHAPTTNARVAIGIEDGRVTLSIRNRRPDRAVAQDGLGSGIAGMASRAEQLGGSLRAGPDGEDWLVELAVPAVDAATGEVDEHSCPIRKAAK